MSSNVATNETHCYCLLVAMKVILNRSGQMTVWPKYLTNSNFFYVSLNNFALQCLAHFWHEEFREKIYKKVLFAVYMT